MRTSVKIRYPVKWQVLILFFSSFFIACTPEIKTNTQIFQVEDPYQFADKSFSDFYRLKEVIPLETTDSALLSYVYKIVATKDRFFIVDWLNPNCLLCFQRDGKYLWQIDRTGRGPGEYQMLTDFAITESPQQIIVYDYFGKLVYYDWKGNFLNEKKWEPYLGGLELLSDKSWIFSHMGPGTKMQDTAYIINIADSIGNLQKGFFPLPRLKTAICMLPSSLYQGNGVYYNIPLTQNNIYVINPQDKTSSLCYSYKLENYPVPKQFTDKGPQKPFYTDYYIFLGEYIGKNTILFNAYYHKESRLSVWITDKKTGKVHIFPDKIKDKENEVTFNRYLQQSGFQGKLLGYVTPSQITDAKYNQSESIGSRLQKKLQEDDNLVLLIYEEK